ncbi:hypothetical protein ACFO4P_16345 [Epilithonimonas pallida]|uniref:Uncharacterized protein n=1 Tax=Epilithonimonas pallida TaxID=373671 RepID=A0ABY1R023_9FLAO|nr:hypothetical protein [Epilithonimonas pallida]SMP89011.1 hypothetical protein SAMN05421679_101607 [Epilithonimonas pallida]
MKKTANPKAIIFFLFIIIGLFHNSCKTEDDPENTQNTDTVKVQNFQLVSLEIDSSQFSEQEYTSELGGKKIHIAKGLDDKLHFMIPGDLEPGIYDFQLNSIKIKYDVSKPVLNDSAGNTIQSFKNQINTILLGLDNSDESTLLKNNLNAFNNAFNGLTDEQKTNAELFYIVNKSWFDYLLNDNYSQQYNGRLLEIIKKELIKSKFGTAAFVIGVIGVYYGSAEIKLLSIIPLSYGLYSITKSIKKIHDEAFVTQNLQIDGEYSEVDKGILNTISFQNEVEKALDFKTIDRKIITSDVSNAKNNLLEFFNIYNTFNYWIDKANTIIESVNTLPFVNFSLFTKYLLPTSSPIMNNPMIQEIFSGINFSITNPDLTLKSANFSTNQLKIKIKNNSNNSVSDYLKYSYSDGFSTFSGKFPITVSSSNPLKGIWTMDFNLAPPGNNCDEIDLEDEAGIPPTFHFGDNGKIIFDSMSDPDWFPALNNPAEYNNTYTMEENVLKIQTHYFQNQYGESFTNNMTLTYNSTANNFSGKYVYQYFLNGVLQYMCSNTVKIYK